MRSAPLRTGKHPTRVSIVAAAWAVACGCSTSKALQIRTIDVVTGPPANIAIYMKVSREDGLPVMLEATNFTVYEDGKAMKGVRRALLPPQSAVDRFILVLVDLSGPLADSEYLPSLHDELAVLAARIGKEARLGLGAFDGDGVKFFLELDDRDRARGLAAMRKFRPANRNVDLRGAFTSGLDKLEEASRQSSVAHRETTLVLVTDRRDKAGRQSRDEVESRLRRSKTDVYVIGIGNATDHDELESLGRSGALFVDQPRDLQRPFVDLADKLESKLAQDYVFAYCSPKREQKKSAKHALQIRIQSHRFQGALEHSFSAKGFGRESCDPNARVSFPVTGGAGGKAIAKLD
jgi:hypothetical protein